MRHEKIIKRPDGSRIKIIASIHVESWQDEFRYNIIQVKSEPNKRTFGYTDEATPEEIQEAKLELWMKLKP